MTTETFSLNSRTGNDLTDETVNYLGGLLGDSNADTAILSFGPCSKEMHISQVTLNIGSISVGGNNHISSTVETINIKCEWGSFGGSDATIYGSNDDTNADENNGPSSASITITPTDSTGQWYFQDSVVQIRVTVSSTQSAVGCDYTLSQFSLTVQYTANASFTMYMEGNKFSGDSAHLLLEGDDTHQSYVSSLNAGETVQVYARSYDGRKILALKQYEGSTLLSSISGSNLSPYLSENGSVLNYTINITEAMEGHRYKLYVEFDKVVYVTYDTCLSHLKWYHEGLNESRIVIKTSTWHTARSGDTMSYSYSPLFPTPSGWYHIRYDYSTDSIEGYIFCRAESYQENGDYFESSEDTNSAGHSSFFLRTEYARIGVENAVVGATTTYSNFVVYPEGYSYMYNTVSASERTNTGKWRMPTPTREGYVFTGWNTKPDGSGKTYTSEDPFPTEDLTLYSQWRVKPPVTIYIGQTQALRAYVGQQEILNIL